MGKRAFGQFRVMGLIEGASLIILVFIAMPLKYMWNIPEAVSIVGAVHGGLFLLYLLFIVYAQIVVRWPFRFSIGAFLAAFVQFGNLILDYRLKNWKQYGGTEPALAK
ncbi:DUF3817 domain-containing protein [Lentibacillus sediminis]|uniref:DUF3817 domain-containing protein n=1 Tax=Lentibacillus sediminis TaxID=1940529 RepID=UPI000C1C3A52|nr:DUF3817 domain-containing protein [Lentibacillus sediminis]